MKSIPKSPQNVAPFTIGGWPVDVLSPGTMRLLRKIADQDGWTIEEVMTAAMEEFVATRKAEKELETKIICFPKSWMHTYEVRPRKDHRGVDLISDALPFGRLWYGEVNAVVNAIGYAEHYSRSHDAVIRVYDAAGSVIETHKHKGDFKEW